jgi:hypothetical protein
MVDLQSDINPNLADMICLVETWMNPNVEIHWPEKTLHHASLGRGKGVSLYRPQGNDYHHLISVAEEDYQFVCVIIRKRIQLFLVYIKPNSPLATYSKVANCMNNVMKSCFKILVIGDLNFDKSEVNPLSRLLERIGLTQIVQEPTHEDGRTLDHFYVPNRWKDSINLNVEFKYYSDHAALSIELM